MSVISNQFVGHVSNVTTPNGQTSDVLSAAGRRSSAVGLALSGGAAKGMAHVGALAVLEEAGVPIRCVAGTSAGALVGLFYAAGWRVAQIRDLALRTGWRNVAKVVWPRRGFVSFAKMERWIMFHLGDLTFADLKMPFACVATDLRTGEPMVLRQGRVAPAVCASCAIPGLVAPVEINGRVLGDGGISDNLPVAAARQLGADTVIGVDLFEPLYTRGLGPIGIAWAALEILVHRAGGGLETADCLIQPKLAGHSFMRLSLAEKMMRLGQEAATGRLEAIRGIFQE